MKSFKIVTTSDNQLFTQKSGDILRESSPAKVMEAVAEIIAEVWEVEDGRIIIKAEK